MLKTHRNIINESVIGVKDASKMGINMNVHITLGKLVSLGWCRLSHVIHLRRNWLLIKSGHWNHGYYSGQLILTRNAEGNWYEYLLKTTVYMEKIKTFDNIIMQPETTQLITSIFTLFVPTWLLKDLRNIYPFQQKIMLYSFNMCFTKRDRSISRSPKCIFTCKNQILKVPSYSWVISNKNVIHPIFPNI